MEAEPSRPATSPGRDPRWWSVVALSFSVLTVGIDVTILNVALPTLAGSLDASTADLQWFVNSYGIALAAGLLPAGILGDRYGRKRLLLIGLVLFAASSVGCASASSPGMLIATRAVLGLAAAVIVPLSLSVLAVLFHNDGERQKAVAIITAATLLGYPLGPVIGGWLLEEFAWGSVFLINVPMVAIAFAAVALWIPESRSGERRRLDVVGIGVSCVGLIGVTYGLIEAGQKGWDQALPLAALGVGLAILTGFVLQQRHLARGFGIAPLIDLDLFRSRSFTWGTLMSTNVSFVMLGLLFVVPQYFQEVMGASTLATGVRLLPVIGGLILGALVAMRLQGGSARSSPVDAGVIVATGFALLAVGGFIGLNTTTESSVGFAAAWLLIGGLGLGFALPTAMNTALSAVSEEQSGTGSSVIWVFRQVGGTFGVAVLGSILSSAYRGHLDTLDLPARVDELASTSVTAGVIVAEKIDSDALLSGVREAFVEGMDQVIVGCTAIALVSAVLALAIRRPGQADSPRRIKPALGAEISIPASEEDAG
jgi:MFS transporter, DHA2 family, multidrug resistance protein